MSMFCLGKTKSFQEKKTKLGFSLVGKLIVKVG